jgi:hypothetical protein
MEKCFGCCTELEEILVAVVELSMHCEVAHGLRVSRLNHTL